MNLLKFAPGKDNAKLMNLAAQMGGRKVYTFSLLSGYTCPFAKECLVKATLGDDNKYHLEYGKDNVFGCFSASQEVLYPTTFKQRQHNTDLLKSVGKWYDMVRLINDSLPKDASIIRIHVGGDFFNKDYFNAWKEVARLNPNIHFYAYTKSLKFWIISREQIPANFILTASYGGYADDLIAKHNLRYAKVVFSEKEAEDLGLEIDHDDSFAAKIEKKDISFALLLHGVQPKGTPAAAALKALKGKGSYSHKKKDK